MFFLVKTQATNTAICDLCKHYERRIPTARKIAQNAFHTSKSMRYTIASGQNIAITTNSPDVIV